MRGNMAILHGLLVLALFASHGSCDQYSYSTTFQYSGKIFANYVLYNKDLHFFYPNEFQQITTIVNDFPGDPANVPWTLRNRSCVADQCSIEVVISRYGAEILKNQNVLIEMQLSGIDKKNLPIFGAESVKIFLNPSVQGTAGAGGCVTNVDSWLARDNYQLTDAPETTPMLAQTCLLNNQYLVENATIRMIGFTQAYQILEIYPERELEGESDPTINATFYMRLTSIPRTYSATSPLATTGAMMQFNTPYTGGPIVSVTVRPWKVSNARYHIGIKDSNNNPFIEKWGAFDDAFSITPLHNTPTSGSTGYLVSTANATVLANQRLFIDAYLSGYSPTDNDHLYALNIQWDQVGNFLTSAIPLVSFERKKFVYFRHLSAKFMIPTDVVANGGTIVVYAQVYANGVRSLTSPPTFFRNSAQYTLIVRSEYSIYPD